TFTFRIFFFFFCISLPLLQVVVAGSGFQKGIGQRQGSRVEVGHVRIKRRQRGLQGRLLLARTRQAGLGVVLLRIWLIPALLKTLLSIAGLAVNLRFAMLEITVFEL
ncbi:MAG: hypothetical protein KDD45_18425, partial [Bdellovibrionales bacterium]|nr:hypothetical protein [Bdellovibrionales bacterium]